MISLARTPAHPGRPGRPLRLVLPVAALLTILSASAALAAPAVSAAPTAPAAGPTSPASASSSFTWHNFTLLNGWKTAGTPKLITGHPGWAINNGVVYLRGAIKQTGPITDEVFATLPKGDRPTRNLYIQVFTMNTQPGSLLITPKGNLEAFNGNARLFTSLASVSFPTSAIKGHQLTLKNGWSSSQSTYNTGDPSYAVSKGVVYLTGSLGGGAIGKTAFILPPAARPAHIVYLSVYTLSGHLGGIVELFTNGHVQIYGSSASGYTSLANISYPALGAQWHKFTLLDKWKSADSTYGTGAPAYTVIDGVRYLGGSLIASNAPNGLWTRLPAVTRSPSVLEIEVYTFGGGTGGIAVTNSLGLVASTPFTNAEDFTSLGGIAYPPGA